jgi:outer membrane receptor protein involved in Fe transport
MAQTTDSLYHDIELVEITASLKADNHKQKPISATTLTMADIDQRGIGSIKDISLIAPNFYQPDYGSSITSSIYVRGFGSRIDQPVLGLTIDDVPVMNKNSYDFDLFDIRRIELLRGPQGTLYGRNTSAGVMNITTLSPHDWQGFRAMAELTSNLSYRLSAAYYAKATEKLGIARSVAANHDEGYFRNTHTNTMCDRGDNFGARLRLQWLASSRLSVDNTLSA